MFGGLGPLDIEAVDMVHLKEPLHIVWTNCCRLIDFYKEVICALDFANVSLFSPFIRHGITLILQSENE